jgi:hypothetical protein
MFVLVGIYLLKYDKSICEYYIYYLCIQPAGIAYSLKAMHNKISGLSRITT